MWWTTPPLSAGAAGQAQDAGAAPHCSRVMIVGPEPAAAALAGGATAALRAGADPVASEETVVSRTPSGRTAPSSTVAISTASDSPT